MKFHKYLEQLIANRVSISILRTLFDYKGKIFTIRSLADASNVSKTEAAVTVEELEKFGVIKIQPVGRAYQLSLNEKSYALNKIIKPILVAEKKTLDELVTILKSHLSSGKIISAVIFGSVSRGEEKEDSDIDLLVISDDFDYATKIIATASEEISLVFHNNLSPVIFSKKEFVSKKGSVLVRSIVNSYILISGRKPEDIK